MNTQKLLYVFTHGPYSTAAGQEALDAVLIGASFEQTCSALFVHDGVFQLKTEQLEPELGVGAIGLKQYTKTFRALRDFGVERVYVDELSMLARGVSVDELAVDTVALDSEGVASLIADQFRVFTF